MNNPQFIINQKVTFRNMSNDPLTLLTVIDIKGTSITAELPGGARITAEASSFQKFVPKEEGDKKPEKSERPDWTKKKKFFKKK